MDRIRKNQPFSPLFLIFIFCVAFSACKHFGKKPTVWSPLPISWLEYEKGNRIPNASFEQVLEKGPAHWFGPSCQISEVEAIEGLHSLYLRALPGKTAHCKTEKFPLVAGHYDFTVWVRLGALQLGSKRLLTDALSIRLRLFNIDGNEVNFELPYLDRQMKANENNYAFNGIQKPQNLGFNRIHLIPHLHPLDSGWIPKETAWAEVEITLKGSKRGPVEVWFDDFNLFYSKWNFPLVERVERLGRKFQKNFDASKSILVYPHPQELGEKIEIWPLGPKANPLLCVPNRPIDEVYRDGLLEIEKKLKFNSYPVPLPSGDCKNSDFLLIFGDQNLPEEWKSLAQPILRRIQKKGPESYALWPFQRKNGQKGMLVLATDPRGKLYATQTLKQLLVFEDRKQLIFQSVRVFDYPRFVNRIANGTDIRNKHHLQEIRAAQWLPETRLNGLFLSVAPHNAKWWEQTPEILHAAQTIGRVSQNSQLFDFGILINPYDHRRKKIEKTIRFSNPEIYDEIFQKGMFPFLDQGAKHVILRTDDFPPQMEGKRFSYILDSPEDRKKFKTLARAHGQMIGEIKRRMDSSFSGKNLYFVSPWYNNMFVDESENRGKKYLKEIAPKIPKSVPILWTGPTVRSLWIDAPQVKRYSQWLGNRTPMLWDNTLYARRLYDFWGAEPKRAHLCSYFEPYSVEIPKNFEEWNDSRGVFLNSHLTELFRIQLVTAGAFLWNPKNYDPEQVLWLYLSERFGEKIGQNILLLDYLFWSFQGKKMKLENQVFEGTGQIFSKLPTKEKKVYVRKKLSQEVNDLERLQKKIKGHLFKLKSNLDFKDRLLFEELNEIYLENEGWLETLSKHEKFLALI